MKVGYFDCIGGISGDMCLAALFDFGLDPHDLYTELIKVDGLCFEFDIKKVMVNGLSATAVKVNPGEKAQPHRQLRVIEAMINTAPLEQEDKEKTLNVFRNLAQAEGKIHGIPFENVHFHEVGAVDSIVDVLGTIIGLKLLGIKKIYSSPLKLGTGLTTCQHGVIPLPAPATLGVLAQSKIPVIFTEENREMVTPTGASLIATLCSELDTMPILTICGVGYGTGQTSGISMPNLLRLIVGQEKIKAD